MLTCVIGSLGDGDGDGEGDGEGDSGAWPLRGALADGADEFSSSGDRLGEALGEGRE